MDPDFTEMRERRQGMYEKYLDLFYKELPLGECFDLIERKVVIGGRKGILFFVDGLTESENMQRVMDYLMKVQPEDMEGIRRSNQFIATHMPFLDTTLVEPKVEPGAPKPDPEPRNWSGEEVYSCYQQAMVRLYSGLVPLIVEGLDKIIILDARSYPSRSVQEPEKEKTLRGAKDGFTEGFMQNIALIRRRIRDNNLIFKNFSIGELSKTDVAMAYVKGRADEKLVEKLEEILRKLEKQKGVDALTVGDQSLLEKIMTECKIGGRLNPFPKVRYSQRPDIISGHITEGKIAIIVDNSPTVMLIPVGIFDFLQDVDDYYFPQLTGN